jgi:hypothetical protein
VRPCLQASFVIVFCDCVAEGEFPGEFPEIHPQLHNHKTMHAHAHMLAHMHTRTRTHPSSLSYWVEGLDESFAERLHRLTDD